MSKTKQTSLGEINLSPKKSVIIMTNLTKSYNTSPELPHLLGLTFTPHFLYFSTQNSGGGTRNGVWGGLLLTFFTSSAVRSLLGEGPP